MTVPAVVDVKNQFTAIQRTVVSFIIGFIIMQAARIGLQINDPALVSALTVAIGGVWYTVFHYAEVKWNAAWGWMLGKVGAPRYKAIAPFVAPLVAPVEAAVLTDVSSVLTSAENTVVAHTTPPAPPVA
jgi:hypothetical protein